jgi:uncharacterized protein YcbK (DUF882 family)
MPSLNRRQFLKTTGCAAVLGGAGVGLAHAADAPAIVASASGAAPVAAVSPVTVSVERWLDLLNMHTAETLKLAYRDALGFVAPALSRLDWILRDQRANESTRMDPMLYDQLADLAAAAGVEARFEIISGYRSPATNAAMAEAGRGVARHSLHVEGRAVDVRLKGVSCADLRDLALRAGRGGVGYYPGSDFVHIDTGRVRTWAG